MSIYVSHLSKNEELFPILKEYNLGLEVVEFGRAEILDDKERYYEEYKEELKGILESRDISLHGPFTDLAPASRDIKIRNVTKDRFTSAFSIAKQLNSKRIVYHTGHIPKTYASKEWLDNSIEFWMDFTKDKLEDMEIHIENVYEDDYALMYELVEAINHPNFSVCLDIGHVNANSTKTLESWINGLGKKIKHVHLHNNDGIYDNHFGLHKGTINMLRILETLKKTSPSASWTLEILDIADLIESVKFLERNGFLDK